MILDTNALSAAADEHPSLVRLLARASVLAIPVIVLGEFRYGIAQSRHHARYRRWLEGLIQDSTILDITEATTLHCAAITLELRRAGTPIPTNDLWIAALCRQHDLPLLTLDRHFDAVSSPQRLTW